MSTAEDTKLYLDTVFGDTEGTAFVTLGIGIYRSPTGKVKHQKWLGHNMFDWPTRADDMIAMIEDKTAAGADVYVCPYLMKGPDRAKGNAVHHMQVHADVDGGLLDVTKVRAIAGWAIGSGTPGNGHAYVPLTRSVSLQHHEALCRGLGEHLGAKDSKISDNDVLRPPGARNQKPTLDGKPAAAVKFLVHPDEAAAWDPDDLAAFLGVTLADGAAPNPTAAGAAGSRPSASAGAVTTEPVALDTVPTLKAVLEASTRDRSADTMRVVGACRDHGLTLAQARAVVNSRADLAERLAERKDDDVLNCWLKAVDSRQQAAVTEVPAEELGAGPEVISGSGRYFDRAGLLASTLLRDCERFGPLAGGIDGKVWAYADGVWIHGDRILRKRVVDLLGERYRRAHADTVESMVLAREPFINDTPAREYLNVTNGLLDWRTGQLKPHTPAVPSTTRIPVRWNPDAECPNIDRFLGMVVGRDCAPILEEVAGYALYPDQPLHKAVMLDGKGRNGKGTYLRILTALLGQVNIAAAPPQRLDTDKWAVAQLYGKLANLVGDVDPRTFRETATFKQATGQDLLQGEHKYGAPFTFTSRALIVAAFNSLPRSADTTEGFFSRWLVIPFPFRFADPGVDGTVPPGCLPKDPDLAEKVTAAEELEGFLVRAVAGLRRVMGAGRFSRAQAVDAAEAEFRRHADPVRGFLAESVIAEADGWASRSEVHGSFKMWAADNALGVLSARRFTEKVREVHVEMFGYPAAETVRTGNRGWAGIRLRTTDDTVHEVHKVPQSYTPPLHTREKGRDGATCAPRAPKCPRCHLDGVPAGHSMHHDCQRQAAVEALI